MGHPGREAGAHPRREEVNADSAWGRGWGALLGKEAKFPKPGCSKDLGGSLWNPQAGSWEVSGSAFEALCPNKTCILGALAEPSRPPCLFPHPSAPHSCALCLVRLCADATPVSARRPSAAIREPRSPVGMGVGGELEQIWGMGTTGGQRKPGPAAPSPLCLSCAPHPLPD